MRMTSLLMVCTSLSTGNTDPLQDLHSIISVLVGHYCSLLSVFISLCLVLFFLADRRVGPNVIKYKILKSPSISHSTLHLLKFFGSPTLCVDLRNMFVIVGQSLRGVPREPTTLSLSLLLTSGIHWLSVCCDILGEVARFLAVYVMGGRVARHTEAPRFRGLLQPSPPCIARQWTKITHQCLEVFGESLFIL